MNNENKELSRNRERRIERNIKLDHRMKSLSIKIKTEKKKNNKDTDKIKQLEIEMVKIKNIIIPNKIQNALKEVNKIQVFDKNLYEIKQEILRNY